MDELSKFRRSHLIPYLSQNMTGLEIGAFMRPTLSPADAEMKYVDYYSQEELQSQIDPKGPGGNDVVHVDYVVRSGNYSDVITQKFDIIIANHVMEHCCNPISWLNDLASMLKEDGLIFLALPDKKYSFDRFRPDTDLARILFSFFQNEKVAGGDRALEAMLYYDLGYLKIPMTLDRLDPERLKAEMSSIHPGLHLFVFQGETFLKKIMAPILYMGLCPLKIVNHVEKTPFGEFYTILKKGWLRPELEFSDFFSPTILGGQ